MKRKKTLNIGGRLRKARKQAGLTLDALAKTSGVSKAMLSQIEQNKANPTVLVLYNVATALNLEVGDLLGARVAKTHFNVIRADEERYQFISTDQCTIRTLSPLRMEKDIEFYEIILHSQGTLESEQHVSGTEEFLTVARGRVRITSSEQDSVLKKGDSVHFSADVPHSILNLNKSDSVVYLVVKYRKEG
jgi:transcriptional regulator with XRE-family HTH domain